MNKKEDSITWEQFITETPWLYHPPPDAFNERMNSIKVEDIKKLPIVGTFENSVIYFNSDDNINEYFLINNDLLVGYYYFEEKPDGTIKTKKIWNPKNSFGIIRKFLAEYIIPKCKTVESDDMLSEMAFEMWRKMMVQYPQYRYYVRDNDELYPIKNPEDFSFYKEPMYMDRKNSTFIVNYHE